MNMKRFIFVLLLFSGISGFAAAQNTLEVTYFYSDTCGVCLSLKKEFFPAFEAQYSGRVILRKLSIYEKDNLETLNSLAHRMGNRKPMVPAVWAGGELLIGRSQIEERLEGIVRQALGRQPAEMVGSGRTLRDVFGELSLFTLIGAGLLDGINPCAFAVMVFFISFLSVYKYRRAEIVWISIFYIFAIFLTYLALGMGLFRFLYALKGFYVLIKIFYYAAAVFCFLLAACALYDYIRFLRTHQTSDHLLQLPSFIKRRIHLSIGESLRQRRGGIIRLAAVSFGVGVTVSVLEAVCTGQVYVPTLFFILKIPQLRLKAFWYLVVYNLMFILPLVAVFFLSVIGVKSQVFQSFLKKHIGTIKLGMAGLFLVLGLAILTLH